MEVVNDDVQVPIPELLEGVLERGCSDLHLTAGAPPTVRLNGDLEALGVVIRSWGRGMVRG